MRSFPEFVGRRGKYDAKKWREILDAIKLGLKLVVESPRGAREECFLHFWGKF